MMMMMQGVLLLLGIDFWGVVSRYPHPSLLSPERYIVADEEIEIEIDKNKNV